MKKILAIALSVAMILSLGILSIFADCVGWYGDPDAFEPVDPSLELTWVPDAATALDLGDCSLDDWAALNLPVVTVTRENVVAWINDGYVPENFQLNAQFAADKDFLYVAFNIVDDDVRFSNPVADPLDPSNLVNYNTGDLFQLNIDFGNKIKWTMENNPEAAEEMTNLKAVFYSFGIIGDGEDVYISVQESDEDRILGPGDAVNVNPDRVDIDPDNITDTGTKGKTWLTEDGWAAEFCLPFSEMFYDFCFKSYADGWNAMVGNSLTIDENHPLEIGIGLYNLDWQNADPDNGVLGGLAGAYGLHAGDNIDEDTGRPIVTWGPDDLCTKLVLAYVDGMEFTSPYLLTPEKEALETIEETDPETTVETEAPTETETKVETEAPKAETEAPKTETKAPETEAPAADEGCASVVGFGAVAVLTAAAAAVVLKKKD